MAVVFYDPVCVIVTDSDSTYVWYELAETYIYYVVVIYFRKCALISNVN